MTNFDGRIAAALQANAAPPRDPVFRLQVIERRERQRFRRRALMSLVMALAVGGLSGVAVGMGGQMYTVGSVLLFALVLIAAGLIYVPVFGRLLRGLSISHIPR
jgi:hypothetical protein